MRYLTASILGVLLMLQLTAGCRGRSSRQEPQRQAASEAESACAAQPKEGPDLTTYAGVSQLLGQLADDPEDQESERLRNKLFEAFPGCVPHVFRIACDEGHKGSCEAIYCLGWERLGAQEGEIRSFLVKATADADEKRRAAAVYALYGHDWPEATDERLIAINKQENAACVRAAVAGAIGRRSHLTEGAWEILAAALLDEDGEVRDAAREALAELGKGLNPFRSRLARVYDRSKQSDVRVSILEALANCHLTAADAAFLKEVIQEPMGPEHLAALEAMTVLPPTTPGLMEAAMPSLNQMTYYDIRRAAVAVIAHQRPVSDQQLKLLARTACDHDCQTTRRAACDGLSSIGPEAASVADQLSNGYRKNTSDRNDIASALHAIKPSHPLVAQHLRAVLKSGQLPMRENAILVSSSDQLFAELFPLFLDYVRQELKKERSFFLSNLSQFRQMRQLPKPMREEMARLVASALGSTTDINSRGMACKVLQLLGDAAAAALPQVREVLRTPDPFGFEIHHSLHALARMGAQAAPALPEVRQLMTNPKWTSLAAAVVVRLDETRAKEMLDVIRAELTSGDEQRQVKAILAAACLGQAAAPLLPVIERLADDVKSNCRGAAMVAMATTAKDPKPIISRLVEQLSSDNSRERLQACESLACLSRFSQDAIPALHKAMDTDPPNRIYYAGAIFEITRQRQMPVIFDFRIISGGYPW